MQITSSKFNAPSAIKKTAEGTSQTKVCPTSEDQITFGLRDNAVVRTIGTGAVLAATGGGAYWAGTTAAGFLPSGTSGIMGAVTGALLGGAAGGATGLGLGIASTEIWPSDQAGNGMMQGFSMFGGAAVGVVSGAIAGYFGAQPLLVAPATVTGAVVAGMASSAALGMVIPD